MVGWIRRKGRIAQSKGPALRYETFKGPDAFPALSFENTRSRFVGTLQYYGKHVQASRDVMGSYAFIYFPSSNVSCSVKASLLSSESIKAWWYNPKDGKVYDEDKNISSSPFLTFEKEDRTFTPPGDVASEDWVLVLDDATKNYAVPGQGK